MALYYVKLITLNLICKTIVFVNIQLTVEGIKGISISIHFSSKMNKIVRLPVSENAFINNLRQSGVKTTTKS